MCILYCSGNVCSQTPSWLWVQSAGISGYQNGVGISASQAGDISAAGLSGGTSNFMGLSVTSPSTAAFHGRFQSSGNFVWANAHWRKATVPCCAEQGSKD